MNLIIFGPQGSGKGTQADLLIDKLGLFYFEAGSFLRELAKKDKNIDETINIRGRLIPDEIVNKLVTEHLEKNVPERDNLLFDGYPRSVRQYVFLKNWLRQMGKSISSAIFLEISEDESIKRLSARRICEDCGAIYNLITNPPEGIKCDCGGKLTQRQDDTPEAIKERLKLFKEVTSPLLEVFNKEGLLIKVDGERPIGVIFEDILDQVERKQESGTDFN